MEEYIEKVHEQHGDLDTFMKVEQPVYINNNAYFNGAQPFEREKDNLVDNKFDPKLSIIDKGDEVYLSCQLPDSFEDITGEIHSTKTLERVRIVDAEFENPDGSELVLDTDYLGQKKSESGPIGPIGLLKKGGNYIKVW